MSEIKALAKLREFIADQFVTSGKAWLEGMAIATEIQTEVDERFMELPVDADGVPIHVGDVMCSAGIREKGHKVIASAIFEDGFVEYGSDNGLIGPLCQEDWVHVKPRTLEDVLRDVWKEALDYAKRDIWRNPDEVFAERADEIRELLGGDGDER